MHHTASCGAGHSQSARRFPRFVTKSGLIRTFRQQYPASNEFLVLNALKLTNSIPPCQICTPMAGAKDGWAKLARNVKAEFDETRIEAYRGTVSLLFGPENTVARRSRSWMIGVSKTSRRRCWGNGTGERRKRLEVFEKSLGSSHPNTGARIQNLRIPDMENIHCTRSKENIW